MDKHENLKKIQDIERNILREFIRICDKYSLRYFLVEGSLLGAVRHKGMIPWDDDIDVALYREDYEVFMSVVRDELEECFECQSWRWDESCIECITKIIDKRHTVRSFAKSEAFDTNVWIDVFVIDGMPSGKLKKKLHRFRLLRKKLRVMWSDIDHYVTNRKRPKFEEALIRLARALHTDKIINTNRALKALDKAMAKVKLCSDGDTVNFLSEYRFATKCKASVYGNGSAADFDGMSAMIPDSPSVLLEQEYGDYMALPPEESRYKHQLELIT